MRHQGEDHRRVALELPGPSWTIAFTPETLPWIIDGATLAKELGLDRVRLLNDLEATAYGVSMMQPINLETIYAGRAMLSRRIER